jgi:hypothetical protein
VIVAKGMEAMHRHQTIYHIQLSPALTIEPEILTVITFALRDVLSVLAQELTSDKEETNHVA